MPDKTRNHRRFIGGLGKIFPVFIINFDGWLNIETKAMINVRATGAVTEIALTLRL